MEQCLYCGSTSTKQIRVDIHTVTQCQLCGEHTGPSEALEILEDRRAARERNVPLEVYPLVKLIERIPGCTVDSASEGNADLLIYPFVNFHIDPHCLQRLEKLLLSLRHANEQAHTRWIIQATLQHTLTFELKPNFAVMPDSLNRHDIKQSVHDLPALIRTLSRDMDLSWWNQ